MSVIKQRKSLRILMIAAIVAVICFIVLASLPVYAAPSVRYWVLDSGTTSATTNWSYTSGGAGGDPVPDAETTIYFDAASFTGGGKVVTVDAPLVCASMIFTDATDAPDLKMTDTLTVGGDVTFLAGVTVSGAAAIIITGTGNFDGAGITFPELQLNGSAHTINGANTFTTLTRTGTAADTTLTLAANQITTNLTLAGNSIHNRLTVNSSAAAQRTITSAVNTFSNVDFQYSKGAGVGSWDVSAIAGGSVDLGNNTDITFSYERYWVGAGGTWDDPLNHWAFTTGGTPDTAFLPSAIFNVTFDANSGFALGNNSVTAPTGSACNSMTWNGAPANPIFTFGATFYLYGSWELQIGMSVRTNGYNGITFHMAGSGVNTIKTNGASIDISVDNSSGQGTINFDGSGSWTLLDDFAITATVNTHPNHINVSGGTLSLDSYSLSITESLFKTDSFTLSSVGVLNLNTGNIIVPIFSQTGGTLNGNTGTITVTSYSCTGGTVTIGTAVITDTGDFGGGGKTYHTVNLTGITSIITGSNTFTTLTRTGTATQTDSLTLTAGTTQTVSGTFTATGNSATNRLMVMSSAASTATINAAVTAVTNTDFYYITGAGLGDWDISAVAGESVEFGTCVGITFTYAYDATRDMYWYGDTGTWGGGITSANCYHWSTTSGGVAGAKRLPMPTSTNSVFFDAASFTLANQAVSIQNQTVYCNDITWTGALNNPQFVLSSTYYGGRADLSIYGSLTFITNMTIPSCNTFWTYNCSISFLGTTGGNITLADRLEVFDLGEATLSIVFNGTGTWTFADDFKIYNGLGFGGAPYTVTLTQGTIVTGNNAVVCGNFASSNANIRTLTLGSSAFTCNKWDITTTTNLTFTANTATINCSGNFAGGSLAYGGTVNITGASTISGNNTITTLNITSAATLSGNSTITTATLSGTGTVSITGSNSFTTLNINRTAGAKIIHFTTGTNQTVSLLDDTGTGTAVLTLDSSAAGNTWTITDTSGVNVLDYLTLQDSIATGGATFFAGIHSTDTPVNTGWLFSYTVPDNGDPLILSRNDVNSYSDYYKITVNGLEELWYQPSAIISGTTILDKDSTQDGTITFGTNATDVTATWESLTYDTGMPTTLAGNPEGNQQGIAPPVGGSAYNTPTPTVATNFLTGVFTVFNQISMITPDGLNNGTYAVPVYFFWLTLFTLIIFGGMVLSLKYLPNQLIGAIAEIGLSILAYRMGIYPFAAILIIVVCSISIIIWERKTQV